MSQILHVSGTSLFGKLILPFTVSIFLSFILKLLLIILSNSPCSLIFIFDTSPYITFLLFLILVLSVIYVIVISVSCPWLLFLILQMQDIMCYPCHLYYLHYSGKFVIRSWFLQYHLMTILIILNAKSKIFKVFGLKTDNDYRTNSTYSVRNQHITTYGIIYAFRINHMNLIFLTFA